MKMLKFIFIVFISTLRCHGRIISVDVNDTMLDDNTATTASFLSAIFLDNATITSNESITTMAGDTITYASLRAISPRSSNSYQSPSTGETVGGVIGAIAFVCLICICCAIYQAKKTKVAPKGHLETRTVNFWVPDKN
jgi:hypothetical protein